MRRIAKYAVAAVALIVPVVPVTALAEAAPKEDRIAPLNYPCGSAAPPNYDPSTWITGAAGGARIRNGSDTSCRADGDIQPSDPLDYYCYTKGPDGLTWTYLLNRRTFVNGWTRDDLLPNRGSAYQCGQ